MKKVLLIILIILVLAAIPVTLLVVKQRQEIRQRAAPATTLFFEPATVTKTVNDPDTFSLNVMIDTGDNVAYGTDLYIDYDATYLDLVSMQNGTFFDSVFFEPDISTPGKAYIAVGSTNGVTSDPGNPGVLATLTFKVKDQTTTGTQIVIDRETAADPEMTTAQGTEGAGVDIIVGVQSASVTINEAAGASPSPTPSTSPGPSPSTTPGASPSPTPTPAASPSPSPSSTTNSYVFITTPTNGTTVTVKRPTMSGTAYPNGLVVLSLSLNSSAVLSSTVYANASGNWSYIPTQDLSDGTYTTTVTGSDSNNQNSEAASSTFTVSTGTGGAGIASPTPTPGTATPTPNTSTTTTTTSSTTTGSTATSGGVPVTGTALPTYSIVGLAAIFLLLGLGAILLPK